MDQDIYLEVKRKIVIYEYHDKDIFLYLVVVHARNNRSNFSQEKSLKYCSI